MADHGPGVPPEARGRIFERFARLDPRRTGGTGLGLSIVAAICAAHGGTVRVADRPGGGALFCLSIPYLPAAVPQARSQFQFVEEPTCPEYSSPRMSPTSSVSS